MPSNKLITGAAAIVASGALIGTGAALSGAATGTPTPGTSASSTPAPGQPGGHAHTPVTGDELAEVTAVVTAKDPDVTVTSVRKDPDGSYDVDGTKDGAPVRFDVSADLTTITASARGGHRGGGHAHTPVTGDELAEVTAVVTAKDPDVTVTSVRKDPDGSYDVDGTKDGAPVRFDVSADLGTITARTGGKVPHTPHGTPSSTSSTSSTSTSSTAI